MSFDVLPTLLIKCGTMFTNYILCDDLFSFGTWCYTILLHMPTLISLYQYYIIEKLLKKFGNERVKLRIWGNVQHPCMDGQRMWSWWKSYRSIRSLRNENTYINPGLSIGSQFAPKFTRKFLPIMQRALLNSNAITSEMYAYCHAIVLRAPRSMGTKWLPVHGQTQDRPREIDV